MGAANSKLTRDQLIYYEENSFFTQSEIRRVFRIFAGYVRDKKIPYPTAHPLKKNLTRQEFAKIPELAANPFRERIARVFSENECHAVRFEDFLDFFSVFSEDASRDVKSFYAFKIYDFDEDGYLDRQDMLKIIRSLVGKQLSDEEVKMVCDKIFDEADMDGDQKLSFMEFDHIISRAPNFEQYLYASE